MKVRLHKTFLHKHCLTSPCGKTLSSVTSSFRTD